MVRATGFRFYDKLLQNISKITVFIYHFPTFPTRFKKFYTKFTPKKIPTSQSREVGLFHVLDFTQWTGIQPDFTASDICLH